MYFKQMEQLIFENASWAEDCTREHVVNALLALDPEMTDRQVLSSTSPLLTSTYSQSIDTLHAKDLQHCPAHASPDAHGSSKSQQVGICYFCIFRFLMGQHCASILWNDTLFGKNKASWHWAVGVRFFNRASDHPLIASSRA